MATAKHRILVAPDSFKGSLTSHQAAEIIAATLYKTFPDAEIVQCPLADGGEGTKAILKSHLPEHVCLIESAKLIGLNLPQMRALDVMERGSGAVGEAILTGLDAGRREFVIGLGGSATNDCGLGMLMALGMQAFNEQGTPVEPNLAGLFSLTRIEISGLDPRLSESRLTILSDVVSPLCGKNGATAVYGPQKGVTADDIGPVDRAMQKFSDLCGDAFDLRLADQEGAGAAGGLGLALMLLGGRMVSGADYVMEKCGFYDALTGTDWVVTGEGCSDAQTLQGKLPLKVAQAARETAAKVALISGSVDQGVLSELEHEFDLVISAKPDGMGVGQALQQAEKLLKQATERFIFSSSSSLRF